MRNITILTPMDFEFIQIDNFSVAKTSLSFSALTRSKKHFATAIIQRINDGYIATLKIDDNNKFYYHKRVYHVNDALRFINHKLLWFQIEEFEEYIE